MRALLKNIHTVEDFSIFLRMWEELDTPLYLKTSSTYYKKLVVQSVSSDRWSTSKINVHCVDADRGGVCWDVDLRSNLHGRFSSEKQLAPLEGVRVALLGTPKPLTKDLENVLDALGGTLVPWKESSANLVLQCEDADPASVALAEENARVLVMKEDDFLGRILPARYRQPKELKTTLRALKKLLKERDLDKVHQGVELAGALEDSGIFDEFLLGTRYDHDSKALLPPPGLKGTGPAQEFLNVALTGLISVAPEECAIAEQLRREVRQLEISLKSLRYLCAFPALEYFKLTFPSTWGSQGVQGLHGLEGLTQLKSLEIRYSTVDSCLPLRECEALEVLELDNCEVESLEGLAGHSKLQELHLTGWSSQTNLKNLDELKGCTALRVLALSKAKMLEQVDGLSDCLALEKVRLRETPHLVSLDGLKGLPKLKDVELDGTATALVLRQASKP